MTAPGMPVAVDLQITGGTIPGDTPGLETENGTPALVLTFVGTNGKPLPCGPLVFLIAEPERVEVLVDALRSAGEATWAAHTARTMRASIESAADKLGAVKCAGCGRRIFGDLALVGWCATCGRPDGDGGDVVEVDFGGSGAAEASE